jgi:hypothetical protein
MIRLRRKDGSVLDMPDQVFIEMTDLDGGVAIVFYTDAEGKMHVVKKADPEAEHYRRLYPDVKFVDIVHL